MGYIGIMISNDKYAQLAADAQAETGWELTPSEVRQNLEYAAQININEWLRTGRTDQFSWE